ncbi:hypothetical protein [Streptomyces sp. BA2]|uniref:hypothetical protein n=1 Tax=Streptomyces sp. BA2 TaxID=436595 RepID=UPI00132077D1|nr:hypothetical protein [Streptomyces sp. BA2]MWA07687.1 hypothetical protein [Streptomyces sp. BA2]
MNWLDDVPSLDIPNLRDVQQISRDVLNRLAEDRKLLTRLVDQIPDDADRLANSRITLLLNRLSLYQAPDCGFEIRMNMNPRRTTSVSRTTTATTSPRASSPAATCTSYAAAPTGATDRSAGATWSRAS